MTDDLVKNLREFADDGYPELSIAAADRIEALTADRENRLADLRIIKAERDDLKREVAISDALLISEAEASLERLARAEKAEADNARLREALQVYANSCDATETSPCGYEGNMCCHTARAALNTGKEPSHE